MSFTLSPAAARKRDRLRAQAIMYLVGGVLTMVFLTLYLGPKAQAQRQLDREALRVGAVAPTERLRDTPDAAIDSSPAPTPPELAAAAPAPADAAPADSGSAAAASSNPLPAQPAGDPPAADSAEPAAEPAAAPTNVPAEPAPAAPAGPPPPEPVIITRFSTGSSVLSPPQLAQIDRAASALHREPTLHAEVRGHADPRGSEAENTPLSQKRAEAVTAALRARGIQRERLRTLGSGAQDPVDPAESISAFARNRRVEIVFVRKEAP